MIPVNYIAVLVAAIASFAIGAIWHGPLFGKYWMALMGFTPDKMKSMMLSPLQAMTGGFLATLLTSYTLAVIIGYSALYSSLGDLQTGLVSAFWVWLGIQMTLSLNGVLWEGRKWNLWLFNNAYQLIATLAMGAIIGGMGILY